MEANLAPLLVGSLFRSRYQVVRAISAGGFGTVYEALDLNTNGPRALKLMHPGLMKDPDLRRRFEQEARVTGGIQSDHIVKVFDAGVDEATLAPFLVMELLHGESLAHRVGTRGALPAREVLTYLTQCARALEKTHAAGIIHRDLKPDNIMLTMRDDGTPCVKVLDFGIAKVTRGGRDKTTQTMGTPLYMAPEQIRGDGDIGPRADIYALVHIAYELLTGEAFLEEEHDKHPAVYSFFTHVLAGTVTEAPVARALRRRGVKLPATFDAWFARGAALDPAQRPGSALAAVASLADVLGLPMSGPAPGPVAGITALPVIAGDDDDTGDDTGGVTRVWRKLTSKRRMGHATWRRRRFTLIAVAVVLVAGLTAVAVIVAKPPPASATNEPPAPTPPTSGAAPDVTPAPLPIGSTGASPTASAVTTATSAPSSTASARVPGPRPTTAPSSAATAAPKPTASTNPTGSAPVGTGVKPHGVL